MDKEVLNLPKKLPEDIYKQFLDILEKEREFVGEKHIDNGFLIKRNRNRVTLGVDDGKRIYVAKLVFANKTWNYVGNPSIWENIRELLTV